MDDLSGQKVWVSTDWSDHVVGVFTTREKAAAALGGEIDYVDGDGKASPPPYSDTGAFCDDGWAHLEVIDQPD